MNKLFIASTLAASLLFTACTNTTAFDFFSTDEYYEKAIANMQKASLMKDSETKALVQGVYLNKVDPIIYSGDEYFFIAMHIIKDEDDVDMQGLANVKYNLQLVEKVVVEKDDITKQPSYNKEDDSFFSMNVKDFYANKKDENETTKLVYIDQIESIELPENHRLRKSMPAKSQWNHYYLIRYKKVTTPTITLSFENKEFGKVNMVFQKEDYFEDSSKIKLPSTTQQKNY